MQRTQVRRLKSYCKIEFWLIFIMLNKLLTEKYLIENVDGYFYNFGLIKKQHESKNYIDILWELLVCFFCQNISFQSLYSALKQMKWKNRKISWFIWETSLCTLVKLGYISIWFLFRLLLNHYWFNFHITNYYSQIENFINLDGWNYSKCSLVRLNHWISVSFIGMMSLCLLKGLKYNFHLSFSFIKVINVHFQMKKVVWCFQIDPFHLTNYVFYWHRSYAFKIFYNIWYDIIWNSMEYYFHILCLLQSECFYFVFILFQFNLLLFQT